MVAEISVTCNLKQYDGQSIPTQNWDQSDDVQFTQHFFIHWTNELIPIVMFKIENKGPIWIQFI